MKTLTKEPTHVQASSDVQREQSTPTDTFEVKPYIKKELAKRYFPDYTEEYALKKLRIWIKEDPDLWEEFLCGPEKPNDWSFSSRQVKVIVKYLGVP